MDESQREKVEAYVDLSDREVEVVFVGRAGWTKTNHGRPGQSSAALHVRGLDGWEGPPMLVVEVDPWRLHDARFALVPDVIQPAISRLADGRAVRMQPLDRVESKAYIHGVLDHLGAKDPNRRLVDWIVRECDGFPHHLRAAMTTLGREMLQTGSGDLQDLDLKRTAENLTKRRITYSEDRLSALRLAMPLVRDLLERWGAQGVHLEKAERDAQVAIMRQNAEPAAQLRDAELNTGAKLVGAMINRGQLAADAENAQWRCLIPSLRQYALTRTFRASSPPNLHRGGIGE